MSAAEHIDALDYVMDGLSPTARQAAEEHLHGCSQCQAEVASYAELGATLAETATPVPAPPALRDQLMAQIGSIPQEPAQPQVSATEPATEQPAPTDLATRRARWTRRSRLLAAVAAAVLVLAGGGVVIKGLLPQHQSSTISAAKRVEQASDAHTVRAKAGTGTLVVTVSDTLNKSVLTLEGVAPSAAGYVYQAWMLTPSGPVSAGFVTPGKPVIMTTAIASGSGAAVTVEPAGGTERPTTQPIGVVRVN